MRTVSFAALVRSGDKAVREYAKQRKSLHRTYEQNYRIREACGAVMSTSVQALSASRAMRDERLASELAQIG